MTKTYPIETILSLTTGFLLRSGGFVEMHELAEHVAGHPIWTHEFAERSLQERLAEAVFTQHPDLRDAEPFTPGEEPIASYLPAYVARARLRFGVERGVEEGIGERSESPLASAQRLMPDKPILGVVVEKKTP